MTGLPIVWVPGHLCGPWLYRSQIEALVGHHAIIADVEQDDRTWTMAARLVAEAPERFIIAGLSMGGMVAMEAMATAPERIAGAVLMDTDPFAARAVERKFRARQRRTVASEGLAGPARVFIDRFFQHNAAAAERLTGLCVGHMATKPLDVYRAQADALDQRRDVLPLIAGFPGPVAVIVGAEDVVCPPKLHRPLAETLPGAVLTEIAGTGHLATVEAPGAVNAAVAELLTRID